MSKYFYHGVRGVFLEDILDTVLSILHDGRVKTKGQLNSTNKYGFNGMEYISLCRKEKNREYRRRRGEATAYTNYIYDEFCFIFRDTIRAEKTMNCDFLSTISAFYELLQKYPDERISLLFDEWQFKGALPLTECIGIGIPLEHIEKDKDSVTLKKLKQVLLLADALGIDIINSSDPYFIEKYEMRKKWNCQKRIVIDPKL